MDQNPLGLVVVDDGTVTADTDSVQTELRRRRRQPPGRAGADQHETNAGGNRARQHGERALGHAIVRAHERPVQIARDEANSAVGFRRRR